MSNELPNGWISTLVEEIGSPGQQAILTGPFGASLGKEDFRADGVPVFTIGCLTDRGINREKLLFINEEKASELSAYRLKDGDFLFSRMATVGRAGFVPTDLQGSIFNYHIMRLRLDEQTILPRLFFFYVRGARAVSSYLEDVNRGATRDGINTSLLARMPVHLPPRPEQHRIVAKIDSLFARSSRARDELAHIPKLIERYRQAVLESAFRGDLTADWRDINSDGDAADLSVDRLVDEPIRNGLSVRGSDVPPGIPALRLSALRQSSVDMTDVRYLPITTQKAERFLLREGDVLISRGNGTKALIARSSIVPAFSKPTIFPDTAFRLRLNKQAADPEWFSLLWNAPQVRAQIEALAKTTAGIWKVSQSDITAVVLRVPPLSEQLETVKRIKSNFSAINVVEAELNRSVAHLDRLDQSILDKAFTGKLVPQDPADEPAFKLLERIQTARAAAPKAKRGRRKDSSANSHLQDPLSFRHLRSANSDAELWVPEHFYSFLIGHADPALTEPDFSARRFLLVMSEEEAARVVNRQTLGDALHPLQDWQHACWREMIDNARALLVDNDGAHRLITTALKIIEEHSNALTVASHSLPNGHTDGGADAKLIYGDEKRWVSIKGAVVPRDKPTVYDKLSNEKAKFIAKISAARKRISVFFPENGAIQTVEDTEYDAAIIVMHYDVPAKIFELLPYGQEMAHLGGRSHRLIASFGIDVLIRR